MSNFISIEQFRHLKRSVEYKAQFKGLDEAGEPIMDRLAKLPTLKFIGVEKIHGSFSGVKVENGTLTCLSKERVITPEDDNYGFARAISNLPEEVKKELFYDKGNLTIFGERAGKGIQNKVAVAELEKFWVIFAAQTEAGEWLEIETWPEYPEHRIFNIYNNTVWSIYIDFESPAESINEMNRLTLEVEKESPFGKRLGISGIGEGICWHCAEEGYDYGRFIYKNKGEAHAGSKVTKLANIDVEKMKSIDEFIEKTVTEERLQQGWDHLQNNKLFDYEKSMGAFLSWVFQDVLKEEFDTMTESGLNKKDVGSACAKKAKVWYLEKLNTL